MKDVISKTAKICVPILTACSVSMAFGEGEVPKKISLHSLYSSYAAHNYSVISMPEFGDDKELMVSGIVIDHSAAAFGGAMMIVGDSAMPGKELARMAAYDGNEERKMSALPKGEKFVAICALGFTSGSEWMSLSDCVIK